MYNDILNAKYPNAETEKDFPGKVNRAAQFAPYAALTGFGDLVEETARTTEKFIETDDNIKDEINRKIRYIMNNLSDNIKACVTYFVPDIHKNGGAYFTHKGIPVKVKEYEKEIVFKDGLAVPIDNILDIETEKSDSVINVDGQQTELNGN